MMRALSSILLRVLAIGAGLTWLCLALRASAGPESPEAAQARTVAFVVAFVAAACGWPTPPRKPGRRDKERL